MDSSPGEQSGEDEMIPVLTKIADCAKRSCRRMALQREIKDLKEAWNDERQRAVAAKMNEEAALSRLIHAEAQLRTLDREQYLKSPDRATDSQRKG